jgi:hypothetical protein
VDEATFRSVQGIRAARSSQDGGVRRYLLAGLVVCGAMMWPTIFVNGLVIVFLGPDWILEELQPQAAPTTPPTSGAQPSLPVC